MMKTSLTASTSLRLTIAGLGIHVNCSDRDLITLLSERYSGFLSPLGGPKERPVEVLRDPDLLVSVEVASHTGKLHDLSMCISFSNGLVRFDGQDSAGLIDRVRGRAELCFSSQYGFEITDYFLRVALAAAVFRSGGLLLHAAGIVYQDRAYVFFGRSGSGKTTVSRLSAGRSVLNDDLIVLMPANGFWEVHATPFWNPSQVRPATGQARLAGFYRLVQDKQVYLEPMPASQATAELMANIPILSADPGCSLDLLVRVQNIAYTYPVFQLHFLPEATFWQVIEAGEYLTGNEL